MISKQKNTYILDIKNIEITNPVEIANIFNNCFSCIASQTNSQSEY